MHNLRMDVMVLLLYLRKASQIKSEKEIHLRGISPNGDRVPPSTGCALMDMCMSSTYPSA